MRVKNAMTDVGFVRYRLTGLPVDYQLKNISSPDVTNLLLEDLIIWTNYEIEVAAYNGAGLGAFSHKVTEWTLQGGERPGWTFSPRNVSKAASAIMVSIDLKAGCG